eukprot:jgi/Chlat1/9243/Chrsp99S08512
MQPSHDSSALRHIVLRLFVQGLVGADAGVRSPQPLLAQMQSGSTLEMCLTLWRSGFDSARRLYQVCCCCAWAKYKLPGHSSK